MREIPLKPYFGTLVLCDSPKEFSKLFKKYLKRKPPNLETFGGTKYRYAHLGHLHSDELFESPLMRVERHRTLAAPDAYAAKGGWISGRDAKVITYSKRFGEVSRVVISPEMAMYGEGN